jgi:hypothetical protein
MASTQTHFERALSNHTISLDLVDLLFHEEIKNFAVETFSSLHKQKLSKLM